MLHELHDGAVQTVDVDGGLHQGVHRYATDLTYLRKGQDVCNRLLVVPDLSKVWEISNHIGILVTAISNGAEHAIALADVG